eukprot:6202776-Pleurochrysis_carterae.AAC.5
MDIGGKYLNPFVDVGVHPMMKTLHFCKARYLGTGNNAKQRAERSKEVFARSPGKSSCRKPQLLALLGLLQHSESCGWIQLTLYMPPILVIRTWCATPRIRSLTSPT